MVIEWYVWKGTKGEGRLQMEAEKEDASYTDVWFIKGQGAREGRELI